MKYDKKDFIQTIRPINRKIQQLAKTAQSCNTGWWLIRNDAKFDVPDDLVKELRATTDRLDLLIGRLFEHLQVELAPFIVNEDDSPED